MAQHQQQHPEDVDRLAPHINTVYEELLKQLTIHQHAILIDLGMIIDVLFSDQHLGWIFIEQYN